MRPTALGEETSSSRRTPTRQETLDTVRGLPRHAGNQTSLILGKIYVVLPDAQAAKDDVIGVVDESGEDYLFAAAQFEVVEFPEAVRRRLSALQKAG
jgi:hypothetical protein